LEVALGRSTVSDNGDLERAWTAEWPYFATLGTNYWHCGWH